jgi:hypothetical protein
VLGHHGIDHALGDNLAVFIRADGRFRIKPQCFVARFPVEPRLQSRDAAGVDNALDAGDERRVHNVARTFDIGAHDVLRIAGP